VRKLLLFLLLLGAGLYLLYWLDERDRPDGPGPTDSAPPTPVTEGEADGFLPSGPSQLTIYDEETRLPLYKLESRDTRNEGGVDVMTDVDLALYDPEQEGLLLLRLRATRARMRRVESQGTLEPKWEDRLELQGVRADLEGGSPLAPLEFSCPTAMVDLRDPANRVVASEDPFSAESAELQLSGTGFQLELDRQVLEIPRKGHVELKRPGATPATLSATGAGRLTVRREETPEGPVVLEVFEGAELVPGAENPGHLNARHVALRAHPAQGDRQDFELERLDADGAVDWVSGDARFQGERLDARFLPDGRVEHARLEGDPRAELPLLISSEVLPDAIDDPTRRQENAPNQEERLLVLEGQDAIDIDWRNERYELHVESFPTPGRPTRVPTISTRDFRLQSASTIDGWLSEDQRSAHFKAGGGVIVTGGVATLETATFEVDIAPDATGETVLVGTASGGARLVGELPADESEKEPPRPFTLTSPEGLKIERRASGWRVIEATLVEISLGEPRLFQARADRVTDFVVPRSSTGSVDSEGLRFHASGAVQVDFESGRFGGEELDVLSVAPVPHFVLHGTRESKAYLNTDDGDARALEVELTGDTLVARGEVAGSAHFAPRDAEAPVLVGFSGDQLTLDRVENADLLPGERLRTVRVLVEGHVRTSLTSKDQTVVVRSASFAAENRVRLVEGQDAPQELGSLFTAEGNVHADFVDSRSDLGIDCDRFEVERTSSDLEAGFRQIAASGDVRFQGRFGGREEVDIGGDCELLVFDSDGKGVMEARPNGRVALIGRTTQRNTPYRLMAERVDFQIDEKQQLSLLAQRPELRMLGLRARAAHFTADDENGVVLSGAARLSGSTAAHVPFTLDAEEVTLVGRWQRSEDVQGEASSEDQLDALQARGQVDFHLSDSMRARGERMVVRRSNGLLRMEGTPASFEFGPTRLETEWVEFDPILQILVGTGRGRVLSAEAQDAAGPGERGSWTLDFLSASTLLELDSVVLVIQEPLFRSRQFDSALRASWAILWLNREGFQDANRRAELLGGLQTLLEEFREFPTASGPLERLSLLRSAELAGLLREVYFEGPVEVLAEGELLARADAVYLDVASQHGWLARATVNMGGQFLGQRQEKLIVKADWLRISSDASLRADRATVTSCDFDEPHVRVVTGDLKIKPTRGEGKEHYQLILKDNRIELYDTLRIPLPTIDIATDKELEPLWPTLSLADSARFGTLFSFAVTRPADNVGRVFDSIARPDAVDDEAEGPSTPGAGEAEAPPPKPRRRRSDVDAHYKIDGSYLGSRGALLDLGIEIEANEDYWFDLYLGLALDSGEDRGFVRVDEDDRDSLRRWLRSQAYFDHGKSAWSFSYSDQSDAGVQSEFFESQFLRYERKENYVQWRRSENEYFAQGSAKLRVDDFRSEVDELPSLSAYRGRSPIAHIGALTLLHTGDVRAEYLRRRAGTDPHSPFDPGPDFGDDPPADFGDLDGLGEREVVRLDTTQTLELPVPLGAGWKLTPFASARGSSWSEGIDTEDEPRRFLAEAGVRLGASFWKRGERGKLHQIAPFVEYRSELERKDENGTPVFFDQVDRVLSGDFLRFGARSRFSADAEGAFLDLDLVGTYAKDRSDGAEDGWLPFEVFGRIFLEPLGHEFEIFHDARYDLETHRTRYSLVSLGTHLGDRWGVQFSHQRGLGEDQEPLFEAASVSGLYRWTEKWEFEARESFSLLEDQELDTKVVVRRYGHDIVFDIESSVREGEGSSFGISVKPRFGYRPPRVGYVPW